MKRINKNFLLFVISTFVIVSCNNKGEVTSRLENNLSIVKINTFENENQQEWKVL